MSTLRATLLGIAAYFGLGLAVIALILACVLLGALGQKVIGPAAGFLTFVLVFLEMAFLPLVWFVGGGLLAGFLVHDMIKAAIASGVGFGVVSGIAGMGAFVYYTVGMGVQAIGEGASDWWAPWILVGILLVAWVIGAAIAAVIGAAGGAITNALRKKPGGSADAG